jgi:hypothetical protein
VRIIRSYTVYLQLIIVECRYWRRVVMLEIPLPVIVPVPSRGTMILQEEFIIDEWTIPEGFEFDGASIPRIFWRLVKHPYVPDIIVASLVHDYLYQTSRVYPREVVDRIYYDLARRYGVSRSRAMTMFIALRLFGWVRWKEYRS